MSHPPANSTFAPQREYREAAVALRNRGDIVSIWPRVNIRGRNKAEALENIREALMLALDQLAADGVTEISLPPYEVPAGGQVVHSRKRQPTNSAPTHALSQRLSRRRVRTPGRS